MKRIYLDYAATTPTKQEVVDAMLPYFTEHYGNPSSVHKFGRDNKVVVNNARKTIADTMNAEVEEFYFTAGGTESDNWALRGVMKANSKKGNHLITSKIEHHGILHCCNEMEKEGYKVTYLDVDSDGKINLKELEEAITDETVLISIMFANNEIGTIQDVKAIGDIAKKHNVFFHTDAVQAFGNVRIDVKEMNIDLMSISGHKIFGPKGIGGLYIRKGVPIKNFVEGGAQERKRRAGTENVPGIVGFAKAAELIYADFDNHVNHLMKLRDKLISRVENEFEYVKLNGHRTDRLPGNVNISFEFIEGEALLLSLDIAGVAGSSGSACTSGSLDPSHVLMGIGLTHEIAHGSLRLTMGDVTTEEDIDYTVDKLKEIVDRLRSMSPLFESVTKGGKA
ncbi:MAG: cysteine desulfurase NifS [Firmicutes bacterium]|jgi:cysteine desulfurase|nr:cysteine desulfurase NifS [Bacillota bacterium]